MFRLIDCFVSSLAWLLIAASNNPASMYVCVGLNCRRKQEQAVDASTVKAFTLRSLARDSSHRQFNSVASTFLGRAN